MGPPISGNERPDIMIALSLAILTFAGLALIAGMLIADCIAERRHQKWMAERGYRVARR
jgi:hypothetical protein